MADSKNGSNTIQMRVEEKMKEKWQKFIEESGGKFKGITALIKYCVNAYIMGDLVEKNRDFASKLEELNALKLDDLNLSELIDNKMDGLKDYMMTTLKKEQPELNLDITSRIFKTISTAPFSLPELEYVLNIDKAEIAAYLADLLDKKLIKTKTIDKEIKYIANGGE